MKENRRSKPEVTIYKSSRAFLKWRDIIQHVVRDLSSIAEVPYILVKKRKKNIAKQAKKKDLHRSLEEKRLSMVLTGKQNVQSV